MNQQLFAPIGAKTYVMPETKYIIVHTTNKIVNEKLRELEIGKLRGDNRERTKGHPELFGFKMKGTKIRILKFNKITLSIVARMLKQYPDEVMMFVGKQYWFSELPQEIKGYAEFEGNTTYLINNVEKGGAVTNDGSNL